MSTHSPSWSPILRPGRQQGPQAKELPEGLENTLAGGVLWIPYQRLVAGEPEKVPDLLPETLEFVLLPYLGEREAARVARAKKARLSPYDRLRRWRSGR